MDSKQRLEPSAVLDERYEIIELIGQGGKGKVYKARHRVLGDLCALKILHPDLIADEAGLARFQREAKLTSNLQHPNIVQVKAFGVTSEKQPYIVMEYLEGKDLGVYLSTQARLSPAEFKQIFLPVLDALSYAHANGIIHRDLKPSNIFLSKTENGILPKIIDLGLAKSICPESNEQQNLTKTGTIAGTPLYMSPEQCKGLPLSTASDIYSIAAVMYEALTGKVLFSGTSDFMVMQSHLNEEPVFPKNPPLSPELKSLILQALAKEVSARTASAGLLRDEIAKVDLKCQSISKESRILQILLVTFISLPVVILAVFQFANQKNAEKESKESTEITVTKKNIHKPLSPLHHKSAQEYIEEIREIRKTSGYCDSEHLLNQARELGLKAIAESKREGDANIYVNSWLTYLSSDKRLSRQAELKHLTDLNDYIDKHPDVISTFRIQAMNALAEAYYNSDAFAQAKSLFLKLEKQHESTKELLHCKKQIVACCVGLNQDKEIERRTKDMVQTFGPNWDATMEALAILARSYCHTNAPRSKIKETLKLIAEGLPYSTSGELVGTLNEVAAETERLGFLQEAQEAKRQAQIALENQKNADMEKLNPLTNLREKMRQSGIKEATKGAL